MVFLSFFLSSASHSVTSECNYAHSHSFKDLFIKDNHKCLFVCASHEPQLVLNINHFQEGICWTQWIHDVKTELHNLHGKKKKTTTQDIRACLVWLKQIHYCCRVDSGAEVCYSIRSWAFSTQHGAKLNLYCRIAEHPTSPNAINVFYSCCSRHLC